MGRAVSGSHSLPRRVRDVFAMDRVVDLRVRHEHAREGDNPRSCRADARFQYVRSVIL